MASMSPARLFRQDFRAFDLRGTDLVSSFRFAWRLEQEHRNFSNPGLTDEPGLDDLRQPHIADQRQQQKWPIEGRQRNKPE
jgi:hypothetical protein